MSIKVNIRKGEPTPSTPILLTINAGELHKEILSDSPQIDTNLAYERLRLRAAKEAAKLLEDNNIEGTILISANDLNADAHRVLGSLIEGLALALYQFDVYKQDKKEGLITLALTDATLPDALINEYQTILDSVYLVRDLVNHPPKVCNSTYVADTAKTISQQFGLECKIYTRTDLESLSCVGILGVNAGSRNEPLLVELLWNPANASADEVILVGKGITFDSGGYSLKPTKDSMDYMKSDMAGGAAVLGTMRCVAACALPRKVRAYIPLAENMVNQDALLPGDVLQMRNGVSVEVLNTDAEGRLILADALTLAAEHKPSLIISMATLTGAASRAIGKRAAVCMGRVTNRSTMNALVDAGYRTHERVVEFPFWDEYDEDIKSSVADVCNTASTVGGGAITAGRFLNKFAGTADYIHIDIAGPAFSKAATGYTPVGGTAFGTRLLFDFLKA